MSMGPEAKNIVDAGRAEDGPDEQDERRVRAAVMARLGLSVGIAATATTAAKATAAKTAVSMGGTATTAATGSLVPGAMTAAGGATAVAATTGAGVLVAKIAAVLVVVGTLAVGTAEVLQAPHDGRPVSPPKTAIQTATGTSTSPSVMAPQALDQPAQPPAAPLTEPAVVAPVTTNAPHARGTAPRPAPSSAAAVNPSSSLASETNALRQANDAIVAKDPHRALTLLDAYVAQFPHGDLEEESAAARVVALCDAGRTSEGRAARERFLVTRPRSPLAVRVRGACPDR